MIFVNPQIRWAKCQWNSETGMTTHTDSISQSGNTRGRMMLSSWVGGAKYLGILSGLLVVGYAGHQTHWDFGLTKHAIGEHHEVTKTTLESDEKPVTDGWEVEFPS
jgi:hypothetical protein